MQRSAAIRSYGTTAQARPESSFELWAWLFMRVSGILLLVLALGHLGVMHVINTVDVINYKFVAERWGTPFWRTYDMLLLILGVMHGLNGVRIVIDDYVHSRAWRVFWMATLWTGGLFFIVLGALVILTFVEQK